MSKKFLAVVLSAALVMSFAGGSVAATKASVKQSDATVLRHSSGKSRLRIVATEKQTASRRTCNSFLACLFGPSTRQLSRIDYGKFQTSGLSTRASRRVVDWDDTKYPVGSLVVRTPERALYFVSAEGEAIRYRVGVGREGFQWSGASRIIGKQEWPSWTPPQEMISREAKKGHIIPDFMEGGPGNPLGARALYIGGTIFRVHGTNDERSIGGAVSSGCIRMMNADVVDLYNRVKVGSRIYVFQ
jgi:lipoprotein-anchoring transpeptidase ErfK/SrfK